MPTVTEPVTMGQHPSDLSYARGYLSRALRGEQLNPPDKKRLNGHYDAMYSLYQAYQSGGPTAVPIAWNIVKLQRPELLTLVVDERPLLIHADNLKDLAAPTYLMDHYPLYADGFNVLVGPSGGGKSFVALDASGRIATESAVVYVAGEGLSGYAARWEAWKHFHQVDHTSLYFYREAIQVIDREKLIAFIELIAEHQPSFVVIDTLARSAVGVDENSAKEMGEFVGACDLIRTSLNCAVLVVHHTGKNDKIRGSSALYAAADSVMSLIKRDERIALYNDGEHGGKNKHAAAADPKFYHIMPHSAGGFEGAVLVAAERIATDDAAKVSSSQMAILEAIEGYEGVGLSAKEIIESTGMKQASVYRNLKLLKKSGHVDYDGERYTLTERGSGALEF